MKVNHIQCNYDFSVQCIADAEYLMRNLLLNEHDYEIKLGANDLLTIFKRDNHCYITRTQGDLDNPFTPENIIADELSHHSYKLTCAETIYHFRGAINNKYFSDNI